MPNVFNEVTVFDSVSYLDEFNSGAPIDLAVGDQLVGTVGETFPTVTDIADEALINVIAGLTYTFTATGTSDLSPFGFGVIGATDTQTDPGAFELTITFTATTTGTISMGFAGENPVNYTVTLTNITYPAPSEGDDYIVGNMNSDRVNLLGGNDTYIALGGSDIVVGGSGNDSIDGVCGNDRLLGDDGDDTILGGNGRDRIFGGNDNDYLDGGNQEDSIYGQSGNDTLIGDKGDDSLLGGSGDDLLNGGADNDFMHGGSGRDTFYFRNGHGQDTISDFTRGQDVLDISMLNIWDISQLSIQAGGTGIRINTGNGNYIELTGLAEGDLSNADFVLADAPPPPVPTEGGDRLTGTDLGDFFAASGGSDLIIGFDGDDTIEGGTGNDTLSGGNGKDVMDGGSGADRINGGEGGDSILGASGNDVISGGAGNDYINGQSDNDRLFGNDGDDTIFGENGNDRIWGGLGADMISGGAGKDTIVGESGNDTIDGGWGDDHMTGGAGNDVFVFADDRTRADTITDFTIGQDVIQIEAYGYTDISDLNMVQTGADVLITFSDRDSLLLLDIDLADLGNDDFTLSNELIVI